MRSAIASEALSELSALSSYSPAHAQPAAAASLSRRTPPPAPATPAPEVQEPAGEWQRGPDEVRTVLSGFQAGVSRGRGSLPSRGAAAAAPAGAARQHAEDGAHN
jgi:hypothetical protein